MLAPEGPVYQAGTLSGNPIAMTAGLATLSILSEEGLYERLNAKAATFIAELQGIPEATAKSRYRYAIIHIQQRINKKGDTRYERI